MKKIHFAKEASLNVLKIYIIYILMYVFFWILFHSSAKNNSASIEFQSIVSLVLILVTALLGGYFFIKTTDKKGISQIILITLFMVVIDTLIAALSIKGNLKSEWFHIVFYPSFVVCLYIGAKTQSIKKG